MKNTTRNILIGFALAVGVLALLAAVPSQTDFDGTYFKTNTLPISLIGNLVNWQQRTTNSFSSHWVDSGTSDSTLAGTASADAVKATNYIQLGSTDGTNRIALSGANLQFNGAPIGSGGGGTNMMVSTMSCASATLSPTFAVNGLSTTAASCRRLTMRCTLTNNVTTISAPVGTLIDGDTMVWCLIQDGTGSRTITGWDAKYAFGSDITGITLTTTLNKRDFLTFIYNSTADLWYCTGFVRGY